MWLARNAIISTAPKIIPMLDQIGVSAAFAYATRKLSTTYTGYALKVRAGTTNAEADVGFDGTGVVSNASIVTITVAGSSGFTVGATMTFAAFYGTQSVFVKTWYDQSGNNRNLTQNTSAAQPPIVQSGVMVSIGGRAALQGGSNYGLNGSIGSRSITTFSILVVTQKGTETSNYGRTISLTVGSGQDYALVTSTNMNNVGTANRLAFERNSVYSTAVVVNGSNYVISGIWTGTNQEIRANNGTAVVASSSGTFTFNTLSVLSMYGLTDNISGKVAEVIGFDSALSSTDRQFAERNEGSHFGITVA